MDLGDIIGDSKSVKLLGIILGLITIFGILAIVVLVAFGDDITQLLVVIYGALGLNGLGGLVRSLKVDGPIRQEQAKLEVAKQAVDLQITAKDNGIELPPVWRPQ